MAKVKVTITLDRSKVAAAQALTGVTSTSEVIDVALERLVHTERLKADIEAYRRAPATTEEVELTTLASWEDLADETDWAALYGGDVS
jgi:hypothetical protein